MVKPLTLFTALSVATAASAEPVIQASTACTYVRPPLPVKTISSCLPDGSGPPPSLPNSAVNQPGTPSFPGSPGSPGSSGSAGSAGSVGSNGSGGSSGSGGGNSSPETVPEGGHSGSGGSAPVTVFTAAASNTKRNAVVVALCCLVIPIAMARW